jgi:hypothetical protein
MSTFPNLDIQQSTIVARTYAKISEVTCSQQSLAEALFHLNLTVYVLYVVKPRDSQ